MFRYTYGMETSVKFLPGYMCSKSVLMFYKAGGLYGQLLAKNKDCSGTGLEMVLIRQAASI